MGENKKFKGGKRMNEKYKDPDLLKELYWDKEMTQEEIGNKLGCSASTISKYMNKFDIKTRDPAKILEKLNNNGSKDTEEKESNLEVPWILIGLAFLFLIGLILIGL